MGWLEGLAGLAMSFGNAMGPEAPPPQVKVKRKVKRKAPPPAVKVKRKAAPLVKVQPQPIRLRAVPVPPPAAAAGGVTKIVININL